MNLNRGRPYVAIPGPSVIPDQVLQAMHRSAPNIYSSDLEHMVHGLLDDLRVVAGTDGYSTIYIANGHGVWEAALSNTMSQGDRILVLATGLFAQGWGGFAESMGVSVECIDFGPCGTIDSTRVAEHLAGDRDHGIKAVIAVQVDTASSVRNDIASLSEAIKSTGHPALLMVDCIASLACERFLMDDWGVDVMIAASQKGLMCPPGLGFMFFNDRARARCRSAGLRTPYWDWERRVDPEEFYMLFCGTAPTHHLYGLRTALDMILKEEGLDAIWKRHARLARAVWAAVEKWSENGSIALNISDPGHRSHAVSTIRTGPPFGNLLRNWTESNAGLTLGIGLGMGSPEDPDASGYFRIGHMGHVNAHMILGALGVIEAGLGAIGCQRGHGALDAAAQICSKD